MYDSAPLMRSYQYETIAGYDETEEELPKPRAFSSFRIIGLVFGVLSVGAFLVVMSAYNKEVNGYINQATSFTAEKITRIRQQKGNTSPFLRLVHIAGANVEPIQNNINPSQAPDAEINLAEVDNINSVPSAKNKIDNNNPQINSVTSSEPIVKEKSSNGDALLVLAGVPHEAISKAI